MAVRCKRCQAWLVAATPPPETPRPGAVPVEVGAAAAPGMPAEPTSAYVTQWQPTLGAQPPMAPPAAATRMAGIPARRGLIGVALLVVVALVAAFVWPRFGRGHSAPRVLTAAALQAGLMHAADFNQLLGMPGVTDGSTVPGDDSPESTSHGPCGAAIANPAPATAPAASATVLSGSDTGVLNVLQVDPKLFDAFVAANRADMRNGCPQFEDSSDGGTTQVQFEGEVALSLSKQQAVGYTAQVDNGDRVLDVTALFLRRGDVAAIFAWVGSTVLPAVTLQAVARQIKSKLGDIH